MTVSTKNGAELETNGENLTPQKIVLVNSLSPGDILLMTVAIRSLHKAFPGQFEIDVRSPCNEIFQNSPYITPIRSGDEEGERRVIEELKKDLDRSEPIVHNGIKYFIAHYPEIHRSGMTGLSFSDGHRMFMAKQLGLNIPRTGMNPDIFFSAKELSSANPLHKFTDYRGKYWVINAGIKNDYTLKWYNHYQEVIDALKGVVKFVQIGHTAHNHPSLTGTIDLRGKTSLRQLFRVMNDAEGCLTCVSMPMVVSAALEKPCVVVAGAREGVRWQLNPNHRYLYTNGCLPCAPYDGCWKSKISECVNIVGSQPKCMEMIKPYQIVDAINSYYEGGVLSHENQEEEQVKKEDAPDEDGPNVLPQVNSIGFSKSESQNIIHSCIFNTLRILKQHNPEDQYLEAYKWHYEKQGNNFLDSYHLMWWIGANFAPKRILEIGCRTGVSICQLLSSYIDHSVIEDVTLVDVFAEQGSPQSVMGNIQLLNLPHEKVNIIKGSSLDVMHDLIKGASSVRDFYNYILVDGCHDKDYARMDLQNAAVLIAPSGFIFFLMI